MSIKEIIKKMSRRKTYTKVEKKNRVSELHVKGMGDVAFKGFNCLNPKCKEYIFLKLDEFSEEFDFKCEHCDYEYKSGYEEKFYDYDLNHLENKEVLESGEFTIMHDEYIEEAGVYKYCIVCNSMKPAEYFDNHKSRKSKRQGECRLCKKVYNSIKNQTRTTDQHRESSQKRRMYLELTGAIKIDSEAIYKKYGYRCFKCNKDLKNVMSAKEKPLDHTLPASYLWPLSTNNATLLCRDHNGGKSDKWPSEYYNSAELKRLAVLTGIDHALLSGSPQFNPEALEQLKDKSVVDAMLAKYGAYMDEIVKIRNKIFKQTGLDFFKSTDMISETYIEEADKLL